MLHLLVIFLQHKVLRWCICAFTLFTSMGSCRYFTQRAWERPIGMTGDGDKGGVEEDGHKAGGQRGSAESTNSSNGDAKQGN
jgi:hypothetical protein